MPTKTLLPYDIAPGVRAFSTTRVSPFDHKTEDIQAMGKYAAFNVTHYCGDAPQRVKNNRTWLCNELGISDDRLILPHQTHTANALTVSEDFLSQKKDAQAATLESIDALTTNVPLTCIGVSTADCVPLLLFDPEHRAVAAIHAGWRGTVSRIAQHTVEKMGKDFATRPEALKAVIGPSISPEAFEVGEEVATQFREAGFPEKIILRPQQPSAKPHIDLWAANAWLLEEAGLQLENIRISGICTYRHADTFFSARRLGINSGRIFSGIMLQD